jgi:nitroimidazol reductase NimA-like FMN-containing flavoprotein (pyridoxamine 5'-phosphate oxidase superfamily)
MADVRVQSITLDKAKAEELLKSYTDGVLSLTDGQSAYGVPLAYTYANETLYFGMTTSGRKFNYYKKGRNVSFTVYKTFQAPEDPQRRGYWSIILDGKLFQITDPEEIKAVVDMMDKQGKLPPGFKDKVLSVLLKNPDNSNMFKMRITDFGGKELPAHRPEEEVVSVQNKH